MGRLFLLRHGKAKWADPGMRDFDRQLDEKGQQEARIIGSAMKQAGLVPDKVICSTAARARETLDGVNESLSLQNVSSYVDTLYATDAPGYLELAVEADVDGDLMLVGHNPMLEDLALAFGEQGHEEAIDELQMGFRTAGLVVVRFDGPSSTWDGAVGTIEAYVTPAAAWV